MSMNTWPMSAIKTSTVRTQVKHLSLLKSRSLPTINTATILSNHQDHQGPSLNSQPITPE